MKESLQLFQINRKPAISKNFLTDWRIEAQLYLAENNDTK